MIKKSLKKFINQFQRKKLFFHLYRNQLKEISKLRDRQISEKIKITTKQTWKKNKRVKQFAKIKQYFENGQTFLKFMRNCNAGSENNIGKLIRLYTNNLVFNNNTYVPIQLKKLYKNTEYTALNPNQKQFIKNIVKRCLEIQQNQYKNIYEYLADQSCSFTDLNNQEISEQMKQQLILKINEKVGYHQYYRKLFGKTLKIIVSPEQQIISGILQAKYFVFI